MIGEGGPVGPTYIDLDDGAVVIDSPYAYVSIGDLHQLVENFVPDVDDETVAGYEEELDVIKASFAPEGSTFYHIAAAQLVRKLEHYATEQSERTDAKIGIVSLDRYIGKALTNEWITFISATRNSQDRLVARPGSAQSVTEQLGMVAQWAKSGGYDEIVVIDDVLAFGNTAPLIINSIKEDIPDMRVRFMVGVASTGGGWRGIETVQELCEVETECLVKVKASAPKEGITRGMSVPVSRDFTVFGGKSDQLDSGQNVTYPYFLPFSKPGAMIDAAARFEAAENLFAFNQRLITAIGEMAGRELIVADISERFHAVPFTSLGSLAGVLEPPRPDDEVKAYLTYAETILHENKETILDEISTAK